MLGKMMIILGIKLRFRSAMTSVLYVSGLPWWARPNCSHRWCALLWL